MADETRPTLVIRAARLLDGSGAPPVADGLVIVEGKHIRWAGAVAAAPEPYRRLAEGSDPLPPGVQRATYPTGTVLPGLIDTHTHFSLPADGRRYEPVMDEPDGMHLLYGVRNARLHLEAGVTTARDLGARNQIAFHLRAGQQQELFPGPRLIVSGRSITCTRGHFWFCGEEADGPDEVRRSVRRLVHQGADVIKVMTTGGGTAGTVPWRASYTTAELQALVDEAHGLGRLVVAHCRGREGMERATTAGVDVMEHVEFLVQDAPGEPARMAFDPRLAERLAAADIFLSPTIQAGGYQTVRHLRARLETGGPDALSDEEQQSLTNFEALVEQRLEIVRQLLAMGLADHFITGSDSGPGLLTFGNLQTDLELLVQAGMTPAQVIASATSIAARAVGLAHEIGRLRAELLADLLVVEGDPSADIGALRQVQAVYQQGRLAVNRAGD